MDSQTLIIIFFSNTYYSDVLFTFTSSYFQVNKIVITNDQQLIKLLNLINFHLIY